LVIDRTLIDEMLERRRSANAIDALSGREREVLALMAEGLTDRGIAQRLWITPATVETHVRHIPQKLSLPAGAGEQQARPCGTDVPPRRHPGCRGRRRSAIQLQDGVTVTNNASAAGALTSPALGLRVFALARHEVPEERGETRQRGCAPANDDGGAVRGRVPQRPGWGWPRRPDRRDDTRSGQRARG